HAERAAGQRGGDRGGVDRGGVMVGRGQRLGQAAIADVVDVDEAEIVVLAVGPAAFRVVVILKPVRADDLGDLGEVSGRGGGAGGALGLGVDGHQMAVVAVAGAVVARGEK